MRLFSILRAALIGLSLFTVTATHSQEQEPASGLAEPWLSQMTSALTTLNYQLSFVLLKPNAEAEPYRWRHGLVDGVSMEHLSTLNGPGRDVVRIGNKVSYFEPNVPAYSMKSARINGPVSSTLLMDPLTLANGYDFVLVGRSRVSGRAAQQIRIVSRDKSRYGVSLWLDQETALPLKMDILDLNGMVLEQMLVTSLQVTEQPDEYFSRIQVAQLPQVDAMPPRNQALNWGFSWLPEGMQILRQNQHRLSLNNTPVEYALLSDGLVDVSVYMQRVSQSSDGKGALRHQADTLYVVQRGDLEVIVIGKLPAATADAIVAGIRFND